MAFDSLLQFLKDGLNQGDEVVSYNEEHKPLQTRSRQAITAPAESAPITIDLATQSEPVPAAGKVDMQELPAPKLQTGMNKAQATAAKSDLSNLRPEPRPTIVIALDSAGNSVSPTSNEGEFYSNTPTTNNADPRIGSNIANEKAASGVDPQSMLAASKLGPTDTSAQTRVNSQDLLKGKLPNMSQLLTAIPAALEAIGPGVGNVANAAKVQQVATGQGAVNAAPKVLEQFLARVRAGDPQATQQLQQFVIQARAQ